jgi:oligoendopeptidase F
MTEPDVLPHWDLTDVFPSLNSREFVDATEAFGADITRLGALYSRHRVGGDNADPSGIDEVIAETNTVRETARVLSAYTLSVVSTDSFDPNGQRAQSELRGLSSELARLGARFAAWVGACGADVMIATGPEAAAHAWPLRRSEVRAAHQMSAGEEDLFAETSATGGQAWAQLFNDVTSQLTAEVRGRGNLPMAAIRGLNTHGDPAVRAAGYDAEMKAWPTVSVTLAHAMNAIKGEANIVNRRRSWSNPLDASLYANSVDRPTYEAMTSAVRAPSVRHSRVTVRLCI